MIQEHKGNLTDSNDIAIFDQAVEESKKLFPDLELEELEQTATIHAVNSLNNSNSDISKKLNFSIEELEYIKSV
jgi:hypothetical protein